MDELSEKFVICAPVQQQCIDQPATGHSPAARRQLNLSWLDVHHLDWILHNHLTAVRGQGPLARAGSSAMRILLPLRALHWASLALTPAYLERLRTGPDPFSNLDSRDEGHDSRDEGLPDTSVATIVQEVATCGVACGYSYLFSLVCSCKRLRAGTVDSQSYQQLALLRCVRLTGGLRKICSLLCSIDFSHDPFGTTLSYGLGDDWSTALEPGILPFSQGALDPLDSRDALHTLGLDPMLTGLSSRLCLYAQRFSSQGFIRKSDHYWMLAVLPDVAKWACEALAATDQLKREEELQLVIDHRVDQQQSGVPEHVTELLRVCELVHEMERLLISLEVAHSAVIYPAKGSALCCFPRKVNILHVSCGLFTGLVGLGVLLVCLRADEYVTAVPWIVAVMPLVLCGLERTYQICTQGFSLLAYARLVEQTRKRFRYYGTPPNVYTSERAFEVFFWVPLLVGAMICLVLLGLKADGVTDISCFGLWLPSRLADVGWVAYVLISMTSDCRIFPEYVGPTKLHQEYVNMKLDDISSFDGNVCFTIDNSGVQRRAHILIHLMISVWTALIALIQDDTLPMSRLAGILVLSPMVLGFALQGISIARRPAEWIPDSALSCIEHMRCAVLCCGAVTIVGAVWLAVCFDKLAASTVHRASFLNEHLGLDVPYTAVGALPLLFIWSFTCFHLISIVTKYDAYTPSVMECTPVAPVKDPCNPIKRTEWI